MCERALRLILSSVGTGTCVCVCLYIFGVFTGRSELVFIPVPMCVMRLSDMTTCCISWDILVVATALFVDLAHYWQCYKWNESWGLLHCSLEFFWSLMQQVTCLIWQVVNIFFRELMLEGQNHFPSFSSLLRVWHVQYQLGAGEMSRIPSMRFNYPGKSS